MIGTIRRHSTILWWIIVVAVIVSFVIFLNPSQSTYRSIFGGGANERGSIGGRPVRVEDVRESIRQVRMMIGRRQVGEDVEAKEAYRRLLVADKFRQLGIAVSDETLADYLRRTMRDPATGQLLYDRQVEMIKAQGYTEADFLALARYEMAERHLADLVQVPAQLVTPREAESEVRRNNEQALVTAVFFSASNQLASVQVTPEGLGRFFTNRIAAYRTSEKIVASFVKFDLSNHLAEAAALVAKAPDTAAKLEAVYTKRGADAFRDAQGNPLAKDAALAKLREEYAREQAMEMAANVANDFYNDLGKVEPVKAENLESVASKRGLRAELTQPFAANDRPLGLEGVPNLAGQLSRLDPSVPFTEPIATMNGYYIVAVRQRIPPVTPTLDSIRARVTDDYRRSLAMDAARSAGQAFHNLATNALASGKSFAALAAEQKLAAVDLPAFTLQMNMLPGLPPQADLVSLKDAAFALQPGQVSPLVPGRDGGYVVYLRERKPASEEMVKAELPKVVTELRQREERAGFSEWMSHEWDNSGLQALFTPKEKKSGVVLPGTPESR